MSRPVLILTVTCLVLAGSTAYLAYEVHAARLEQAHGIWQSQVQEGNTQ